jgi:hypothetical protein
MVISGPPNQISLNTALLNMGDFDCLSQKTNRPINVKPEAIKPTVLISDQPVTGASITPKTSNNGPKIESKSPVMSRLFLLADFVSGIKIRQPTIAMPTNGMLIRKTAVQENCSTNSPPIIGPKGTPNDPMATQIPMALARSLVGKTSLIKAKVDGIIIAAPKPIATRAEIKPVIELVVAAAVELIKIVIMPSKKNNLRPNRSANPPTNNNGAAKARE